MGFKILTECIMAASILFSLSSCAPLKLQEKSEDPDIYRNAVRRFFISLKTVCYLCDTIGKPLRKKEWTLNSFHVRLMTTSRAFFSGNLFSGVARFAPKEIRRSRSCIIIYHLSRRKQRGCNY